MKTPRVLALALLLLFLLLAAGPLPAATVVFTHEGDLPGAARLKIEEGKLLEIEALPLPAETTETFKLAYEPASGLLGIAGEENGEPSLFLVPAAAGDPPARTIPLPASVSHLTAVPGGFLLALSKGHLLLVDAAGARVTGEINTRKQLSPPARKGEHICLLSPGRALVSFQKDDDDSPALGNRLALLGLEPFQVDADLPLPRDRTELHMPGERKEQGPGPEILIPIPAANTLAITLDLYGAVAFTDLEALLRGELRNYSMTPSAGDDTWGTAFPDRAAVIETSAGPRLIVCNAGAGQGIAVFDPFTRQKTAHFPAAAGCDTPVILPGQPAAATVVSGKLKSRKKSGGLAKQSSPGSHLLLMDFSDPEAPQLTAFELGEPTLLIAAAGERQVIVFGKDNALLVDALSGRVLDRKDIPGKPVRAITLPE